MSSAASELDDLCKRLDTQSRGWGTDVQKRRTAGEALDTIKRLGEPRAAPEIVSYQRRNIGPDGTPWSGWYPTNDEPTPENMKFDGYLSYEYRPLYAGPPLPRSSAASEPAGWLVERPGDSTFPRLFRNKASADALVEYVNVNPPATSRPVFLNEPQRAVVECQCGHWSTGQCVCDPAPQAVQMEEIVDEERILDPRFSVTGETGK